MKKIKFISLIFLIMSGESISQNWQTNVLNNGNFGNNFGTSTGLPINIYTNNVNTAQFSTGNSLNSPWDFNGPFNPIGDGLRINPQTGGGYLDMFTGNSNTTHIKWGNSGSISGQNSRFEQHANAQGFFFNTVGGGFFKFAHSQTVNCFVGQNNFWRIGTQTDPSNISAVRRLEVVDGTWQLRLTNGGVFTDFFTNSNGNLQIYPVNGKVGINAPTNPTATIDVFGDARIRDVQVAVPDALFVGIEASGAANPQDLNVRRLDFSGNVTDVLLGNGTWGPASPGVSANNGITLMSSGVIQLGEVYNGIATVPLLNSREVRINNHDFVFSRTTSFNGGNVGIGLLAPTSPTERLDVDGNGRFRTLPNNSNQVGSSVNKVVVVDANGVLRWRNLSSFGLNSAMNGAWINSNNAIEWGTNPLIHDTEIPMANWNVAFTSTPGSATNTNNVKIGGNATPVPIKLAVLNDVENIGALVVSNSPIFGGTNRYGVLARSENSFLSFGVAGLSTNAVRAYGVSGFASQGSTETIGVQGTGTSNLGQGSVYGGKFSGSSNTIFENYGVHGFATGSPKTNFGGYFTSLGGTTAIGVYGEASSSDPGAAVYAAYFAGPIISGSIPSIPSDIQFKTNINTVQDANDVLQALNPVTYNYLQTGNSAYMHFPTDDQIGLIAQEVELVLPEIVSIVSHPQQRDSLGNITVPTFDYKTVKYDALIPILIQGHKEQNARIDSLMNVNGTVTNYSDSLEQVVSNLNARLTQLENCLSNILPALCNANQMAVQQTPEEVQDQLRNAINVNLSDRNAIVLNQNVPNPFAESTVITYSIPSTVQKAQIHFYDGNGKLINSVDIVERGQGQLNVFANDLSTGVYTYSLVADGKIVSTKRMMKQ